MEMRSSGVKWRNERRTPFFAARLPRPAAVEWNSGMNSFYNGESRICNGLCRLPVWLGRSGQEGAGAMEAKRAAAEEAVRFIREGMTVGLGTGSTAYWAIRAIGARVSEGLRIQAVATSEATERLAQECGIPLLDRLTDLDVTIDGADEVDGRLNAIKGGGGALLREKLVASASRELILIVDDSKCVNMLGGFPLPVEVVPFGAELTMRKIGQLGCRPVLREQEGRPFVTDNGNFIADCAFGRIEQPDELQRRLKQITGVVDHGLFISMADKLIVGHGNGAVSVRERGENDTTRERET